MIGDRVRGFFSQEDDDNEDDEWKDVILVVFEPEYNTVLIYLETESIDNDRPEGVLQGVETITADAHMEVKKFKNGSIEFRPDPLRLRKFRKVTSDLFHLDILG